MKQIETLKEFNEIFERFKHSYKDAPAFEHEVIELARLGYEVPLVLNTRFHHVARRYKDTKEERLRNEKDHLASILTRCGLMDNLRGKDNESKRDDSPSDV